MVYVRLVTRRYLYPFFRLSLWPTYSFCSYELAINTNCIMFLSETRVVIVIREILRHDTQGCPPDATWPTHFSHNLTAPRNVAALLSPSTFMPSAPKFQTHLGPEE